MENVTFGFQAPRVIIFTVQLHAELCFSTRCSELFVTIMKRGRWRSLASLARYEKGGMVTKAYQQLPQALKDHLERCARVLDAVVLGRLEVFRFQ